MSTRPKYFLLDAGPVIELHRLGLWQAVTERAELVLPGKVLDSEVVFWDAGDGVGHTIYLGEDAAAGRITVERAEPAQIVELLNRFDPTVRERVDQGELEAITLLLRWDHPRPEFCTADRMAVVALCLLGESSLLVSLENLLQRVGLGRLLQWRFSDKAMTQWRGEGQARRLSGEGLATGASVKQKVHK